MILFLMKGEAFYKEDKYQYKEEHERGLMTDVTLTKGGETPSMTFPSGYGGAQEAKPGTTWTMQMATSSRSRKGLTSLRRWALALTSCQRRRRGLVIRMDDATQRVMRPSLRRHGDQRGIWQPRPSSKASSGALRPSRLALLSYAARWHFILFEPKPTALSPLCGPVSMEAKCPWDVMCGQRSEHTSFSD